MTDPGPCGHSQSSYCCGPLHIHGPQLTASSNGLADAHLPHQHLLPGWGWGWGHRQAPCQGLGLRVGQPWGTKLGVQGGISMGVSDGETVKDADWEIWTVFGKPVEVTVQNYVGGGESA